MSDPTTAPWLESGYADIVSAVRSDGDIEVEFANGDVVITPAATFGIAAEEFRLDVDPDEALSLRAVTADGNTINLSWAQIRAATDQAFAQELRRRDAEESRRIGLRLRALREDKNLSQRDVASLVDMSPPQLSKIESGTFDLRVSTVQALLRAMGATFADISDPEALEVSQRTLRKRAERAGVPSDLTDRLLARTPRDAVVRVLCRAFSWSREALLNGVPESPGLSVEVAFKAVRAQEPGGSPLVNLAYTVSKVVRTVADLPSYSGVSSDPADVRRHASDEHGQITLDSLLGWMWSTGIVVIPLHGRGGFSAAVWAIDDVPVVVLKEVRELAVFWLFDLAHELGHIARGHVLKAGVVDLDSPTPHGDADSQEQEASEFALDLLLPGHETLLRQVRAEARGSHLRFKGAVATVAKRAQVSPALLGMVAAYELTEVGQYKDRWGSSTNLARPEGAGRERAQAAARDHLPPDGLADVDAVLINALVLGSDP